MFLKFLDKIGRKKVVLDRGPSHPRYHEAKRWMNRYYVLFRYRPKWFPFNILIHEMLADDHGEGVHNHLCPYITIILRGGYWETIKNGKFWRKPGYIGFRSANDFHRVDLKKGTKPMTIFIPGPFGLRKGPRSEYGINLKKMNLQNKFIEYCNTSNFEINPNQIRIVNSLEKFSAENFGTSLLKIFFNKKIKLGFYLHGDVGVGKTMLLNFYYNNLKFKKTKVHFNEFMIDFHDFIFNNNEKDKGIENFVKELQKKSELIFFDEFQVTNIVDAMILGRLFKKIFEKKISVIFSSNIRIDNLYKDGLQRDQFMPFLKILKENCYEQELLINEDYRINNKKVLNRFLYPINETTNFKLNKLFRELTKNKKKTKKIINIKGREFVIENFYDGIVKFNFEELCNRNLGSEDYLNISQNSKFILIENLPDFDENNSDQQQRFITLIDIIYEKKIPILISSKNSLDKLNSSQSLSQIFKRTISRLYELTSIKII